MIERIGRGQDANDRVWPAVDDESSADDLRIGAQPRCPEAVADDDERRVLLGSGLTLR